MVDSTDAGAPGKVPAGDTTGADYTERLRRKERARWKRVLDVQAPYRWNIRRLGLGHTLDVGCGLGRNLRHLGGDGVGVDHNPASVAAARAAGLTAYTSEEFPTSGAAVPGGFDSMLLAHVVEHMGEDDAVRLLTTYLPYVRPGGRVVVITPQERGYASDATHVRFVGFGEAAALAGAAGLAVRRQYSFPLPRLAGRAFTYNEFVTVAERP